MSTLKDLRQKAFDAGMGYIKPRTLNADEIRIALYLQNLKTSDLFEFADEFNVPGDDAKQIIINHVNDMKRKRLKARPMPVQAKPAKARAKTRAMPAKRVAVATKAAPAVARVTKGEMVAPLGVRKPLHSLGPQKHVKGFLITNKPSGTLLCNKDKLGNIKYYIVKSIKVPLHPNKVPKKYRDKCEKRLFVRELDRPKKARAVKVRAAKAKPMKAKLAVARYEDMSYNELRKMAAKRGIKLIRPKKAQVIAALKRDDKIVVPYVAPRKLKKKLLTISQGWYAIPPVNVAKIALMLGIDWTGDIQLHELALKLQDKWYVDYLSTLDSVFLQKIKQLFNQYVPQTTPEDHKQYGKLREILLKAIEKEDDDSFQKIFE
jgi:hypothetical protein